MPDILISQLFYALMPTAVGLAAAWLCSARARKVIPQLLQFDLTAVMLLMVGCSLLFVTSREIHDSQRAYARYLADSDYFDYGSAAYYGFQELLLLLSGMFIVPGLMFARLFIDAQRDDRWSREERRKRLPETVSIPQRRQVELKPQWID